MGSFVVSDVPLVPKPEHAPEVSVVLPCLNEADTVGICVRKARNALEAAGIDGEVIVADNGSGDDSARVAAGEGARVVRVSEKGYGNALMGGIGASRGRFVIMADADDSYDLGDVPRFVERLRSGDDLVQGCRLPSGGGTIRPGAMPFLHRWLGNPALSWVARSMFGVPVADVYCGMRGFSRALYDRLGLRCTGMEFATEMVVRAGMQRARTSQIPIVLHPDGRRTGAPHLRTIRDGWRTLRFFLIYSPRWLFLYPSLLLVALGLVGYGLALTGATIGPATIGAHTLLVSSLAILLGHQAAFFGVAAKAFGVSEGFLEADRRTKRLLALAKVEYGLLAAAACLAGGIGFLVMTVERWARLDFGPLDYGTTLRWVIPAVTLIAIAAQTVLWSFFIGLLGMKRR
ncbi:MAG TPA: glycosyltransferase family 2 protein [Thermoanaerobaculia bacterium]